MTQPSPTPGQLDLEALRSAGVAPSDIEVITDATGQVVSARQVGGGRLTVTGPHTSARQ